MNKKNKNLTKGKKFLIIAIICIAIIIAFLIVLKVKKGTKNVDEIGANSDMAEVKMINGNIYAPKDATIVSDKLEEGIVIKDKNQNEWVWIEVPKDASLVYQTAGLDITEFNNENCQKIRYDLKKYVKGIKREEQANLGEDYWIQMADDGTYSKYDPLVSETYDKNLYWLKRTQGCGISY